MSSSVAKPRVAAVVLTFNGARWLDRTLASLDFCDELLVVDSGSTDATLDIAKAHGARVLHRKWEGTIPQFRFAFANLEADPGRPIWVVTLDQDEWLSPELYAALKTALENPGGVQGFELSRLSWYFDRYVRHSGWRPDWLLRAFRLDAVQIRGVLPHEEFHVAGQVRRLEVKGGDIVHHPYADLSEHLAKVNDYSAMAARELRARGRRASVAKAFAHGFGKLFKTYVLKLGFLDGRAGAVLAVHAFLSAFHKYLRVIEPDRATVDASALPHGSSSHIGFAPEKR